MPLHDKSAETDATIQGRGDFMIECVAEKAKRREVARTEREAARTESASERLRAMYDRLVTLWGAQQWWPANSAFEVVIGAYLTQNTAWKSVERSIANLKERRALTVEGLRAIPEEELRQLIRPSGFMLRKAAALKSFIAFLDAQYGGRMEALQAAALRDAHGVRAELLRLLGVGPETADAILLYALQAPAMVVDEYLRRITTRHALVPAKGKYAEIQAVAEQAFAREREDAGHRALHYNEFHALMVQVGKLHCGRVARCEGCPLAYDLRKHGVKSRGEDPLR